VPGGRAGVVELRSRGGAEEPSSSREVEEELKG